MKLLFQSRVFKLLILLMFTFSPVTAQQSDNGASLDHLTIDGIPSIEAALVDKVTRYTQSRAAALMSWHPTKKEMLIATAFSDTPQIHYVRAPGAARTQLTFFSDSVSEAMFRPKKGGHFVFAKDSNGNDIDQLYKYDLDTGNVNLLTDGRSPITNPVWSHSGEFLVYAALVDNKDLNLFIMNPDDPSRARNLPHPKEGYSWPVDVSPDDKTVLLKQFFSATEVYLWMVDIKTGVLILLTPKKDTETASYRGAQWDPNGKGVYVTTDQNSEFQQLAFIDLKTKQLKFISSGIKGDVGDFDVSPDGRSIAFVANEDGVGRLHIIDSSSGAELRAPQLPVGVISELRWHPLGTDLGFMMTSAKYPDDVYSYNVDNGRVERWTYSETGGISTEAFPEAELIRWKSFDKQQISGFLYRPPVSKFVGPRPVMIDLHGGPQLQSRPDYVGRYGYLTNEMGIAIIYPNVRGSSGYGKEFLKLDNGVLRENCLHDIETLLDWIKTQKNLDGERVMIRGESYGGFLALIAASEFANRLKGVIAVSAPTNLVSYINSGQDLKRTLLRIEYGDERDPQIAKFYQRFAPLNNAERITVPVFIAHGKNDTRVPPSEAELMVAALKKTKTPVWSLTAQNEGHLFSKTPNRDYLFFATVKFAEKYLMAN